MKEVTLRWQLLSESLIDKLGLSGKKVPLEMSGIDGKSRHMSRLTSMIVCSPDEPEVRHSLIWSLPDYPTRGMA